MDYSEVIEMSIKPRRHVVRLLSVNKVREKSGEIFMQRHPRDRIDRVAQFHIEQRAGVDKFMTLNYFGALALQNGDVNYNDVIVTSRI